MDECTLSTESWQHEPEPCRPPADVSALLIDARRRAAKRANLVNQLHRRRQREANRRTQRAQSARRHFNIQAGQAKGGWWVRLGGGSPVHCCPPPTHNFNKPLISDVKCEVGSWSSESTTAPPPPHTHTHPPAKCDKERRREGRNLVAGGSDSLI